MQPGVTVVLATVWLAVAAGVVGVVTPRSFRPSHDQYSPTSPRYGVQRDQINRRDQDPAEDQPLDLWIGSRGSIPAEGWQRKLPNITGAEFVADKIDYGEMPEMLLREVPPSGPDDSFVADNTFQDQGLSSAKIYNLDLPKEKVPLMATASPARLSAGSKSKAPKKTDRVSANATEMKPHGSRSNLFEEQRTETPINRDAFGVGGVPELQVGCEGLEASSHKARRSISTLDKEKGEAPTAWLDVTPITLDLDYDLSYDEEDYEEMDELFKLKRLEETTTKRVRPNRGDMDATLNSNRPDDLERPEKLPVRGDLGDSIATNSSGLVVVSPESEKIGRDELSADLEARDSGAAETKRQRVLSNGSSSSRSSGRRLLWLAEANTEGFADDEQKRAKQSIVWGFGENEGVVSSDELQTVNERRRQHDIRYHQDVKGHNQQHAMNSNVESVRREHERMLEQRRREEEERLRRAQQNDRRTPSGWEEEEERRRDEMRRRQYEEYRRKMGYASIHGTHDEETRRREMEERRRQEVARDQTRPMTGREEEERKRREEQERRWREEEESRRRPQDLRREEERRRQEEDARRSESRTPEDEDEERRRRLYDEEMRRRAEGQDEETRRQEQYRWQQEMQRRREEEARRRASQEDAARSPLSEEDRGRQEERHRERLQERRRQDEEERKRQRDRDRSEAPSNLMRTGHGVERPRPAGPRPDRDHERRMREEREREERAREQKLRNYIARNRPININQVDRRSEEEKRRHWPEPNARSRTNLSRNDEDYRRRAEEQRRRQEEERKLQDYIKRNQPVNVPSRNDQSVGRNWFEERRLIEEARQRGRYPDPGAAGRRGPSQPTNIDPQSSLEEARRRQEARRLEEERRQARERQQRYETEERRKELARRQQAEEERRLQEERRNEVVRREEEARRAQSTRYEDDRKRMEAARIQAERRRQEALRERTRDGGQAAGGTRRPEAARSPHQDPRLAEHRRRQESRPIPSNLARDETRREAERERQRQERARLEAERRRHEESRMREQGQRGALTEQWRRQQITRLHGLPVNARIIIRPSGSSSSSDSLPSVLSRGGFENEIDFTGMNPNRRGVQAPQFPAPSTSRPPLQSPAPCIWAIVQCCSHNNNRLVKCFESMGCPGINWDPNPCRTSVKEAARKEVMMFYAKMES